MRIGNKDKTLDLLKELALRYVDKNPGLIKKNTLNTVDPSIVKNEDVRVVKGVECATGASSGF